MKLTKDFLRGLIKEELEKTTLSEARYAIYAGKPSSSKPPIKIFASMEAAEAGKEQLYKEYPYAAVQKFKPGGMWELTVGEYAEKSAEPTSGGTGKYYVSIGAGRWAGPYDSHDEASLSHDRGIIRQFNSNPNLDEAENTEKAPEPVASKSAGYYVSIGAGRWAGPYKSHEEASLSHDRGIIRQFDSNPNRK